MMTDVTDDDEHSAEKMEELKDEEEVKTSVTADEDTVQDEITLVEETKETENIILPSENKEEEGENDMEEIRVTKSVDNEEILEKTSGDNIDTNNNENRPEGSGDSENETSDFTETALKMGNQLFKRASATAKATGEVIQKAALNAKQNMEQSKDAKPSVKSSDDDKNSGDLKGTNETNKGESDSSATETGAKKMSTLWGKAKRLSGAAVLATKTVASQTASSAAATISHGADVLKQKTMSTPPTQNEKNDEEGKKDISTIDVVVDDDSSDTKVEKTDCESMEGSTSDKSEGKTEEEESLVKKIRRASVTYYRATEPVVVSTVSTVGTTIKDTASTVYTKAAPVVASAWHHTKEGTTTAIEKTKEVIQRHRGASVDKTDPVNINNDENSSDQNSTTAEVSGSVQEGSVYSGDGGSAFGDNDAETEQRLRESKSENENLVLQETDEFDDDENDDDEDEDSDGNDSTTKSEEVLLDHDKNDSDQELSRDEKYQISNVHVESEETNVVPDIEEDVEVDIGNDIKDSASNNEERESGDENN